MNLNLIVYFEGQFWVGVVEVIEDGKLRAGRHVFGAEPNDSEILDFVNRFLLNVSDRLSQEVSIKPVDVKVNPKRLARQVSQELQKTGISTRAEEAIKLEYESRKKEKQILSRKQQEEQKEKKRLMARQKAKAKHRGR